jgi:hypothetical protein
VSYTITITVPATSGPLPAQVRGTFALAFFGSAIGAATGTIPPSPQPPPPPLPLPPIMVSIHRHDNGQSVAPPVAAVIDAAVMNGWMAPVPPMIAAGTYFVVAVITDPANPASTANLFIHNP